MAADAPQAILQRILTEKWPDIAMPEYQGAVPGRKFRIDVAFPEARLAVECDGWEHHGRYKGDFQRDRERDRLMLLSGWRVLRFYASEIKKSPVSVIETVTSVLAICTENS
jgi:very-short-patch-repair endonuclease